MKLLAVFNTLLLLITLSVVVTILVRLYKEPFENCVGVQYNGLNMLDNPTEPVCTQGIKSRFRDGGCLEYNPDNVAIAYMQGKFIPGV